MKKIISTLLLTSLLSIISTVSYANSQLNKETENYIAAFKSGSFMQMNDALGDMKWKGITDKRIFNAMLKQFNQRKNNLDKAGIKQTAYLARGLAMSGSDRYKKILESELEVTSDKRLKKYYSRAISEFENYALLNPIISKNISKAKDIHVQRVKNMLSAEQPNIIVIGAKRVYHIHYANKELVSLAAKRLLDISATADDRQSIDAGAWLCKALSKSGMTQHREVLSKVADTAGNKRLRKYAAKYLKTM